MKKVTVFTSALLLASFFSSNTFANEYALQARTFEVTVTNITIGETFTPILAAAHSTDIAFFELGQPASEPLAELAEAGNVMPLQTVLESSDEVGGTSVFADLIAPGESVTFEITNSERMASFSLAAMLIPTNDTFVALDSVALPPFGSVSYLANAYDAGSEPNDELCVNMPGPACGGEGGSPDEGGEGYVFSSPGIHGEGDLLVSEYGFSGPVAKVVITRIN